MIDRIMPIFTDQIPPSAEMNDATLYVSVRHNIAIHKCACGCNREVVTPIAPDGWTLIYDGTNVSLTPSIGNWNFPCRSHYYITKNTIDWDLVSTAPTGTSLKQEKPHKKPWWKRLFGR